MVKENLAQTLTGNLLVGKSVCVFCVGLWPGRLKFPCNLMLMDSIFYTVFILRIWFQVSVKDYAVAYPEHRHLKPYTQKEE